ncbi:MAG: hypothetical protein K8T25_19385 [Planctomycetia bacterium]|nr:hypothetical protein [Planctomycetia bacterium]
MLHATPLFCFGQLDKQAEREGRAITLLECLTGGQARQEPRLQIPPRRVRFSRKLAADRFAALFSNPPTARKAASALPPTWADLDRRAQQRAEREADKSVAAQLKSLPPEQARYVIVLARKGRQQSKTQAA